MHLNHDCIRDVLFYLEKSPYNEPVFFQNLLENLSTYSKEDLSYTCIKLYEADMIKGHFIELDGENMPYIHSISDITMKGHEFLNDVRSDVVWKKTKGVLSKIGSTSISSIVQVASGVLTAIIKNELGLI